MASTQQQPPSRNYTHLDAADEAVAAERGTAENGTTEVRNPLAPPTSEPPPMRGGAHRPSDENHPNPDAFTTRPALPAARIRGKIHDLSASLSE